MRVSGQQSWNWWTCLQRIDLKTKIIKKKKKKTYYIKDNIYREGKKFNETNTYKKYIWKWQYLCNQRNLKNYHILCDYHILTLMSITWLVKEMIIKLGSNKKKGCIWCKKLPLFAGFRRGHDRQPFWRGWILDSNLHLSLLVENTCHCTKTPPLGSNIRRGNIIPI